MIAANNLSMRFGGKILFKNVNFQLNPGQHYGLVGANGCGKSTLIKILTGEATPETGDISCPSQASIGTLKQNQFLYDDVRIVDTVMMGKTKLWEAISQKEQLLQKEKFGEEDCHLLEELEKIVISYQGYSAESEAAKLLEGLGLNVEVHKQHMKTLSGGYKLRVLLAQVLFSQPDILLLDEPTNHLDIYSIKWLEDYLKGFPGTLLISSHDRDFLNSICHQIVDMDYGNIKIYKGNYDRFQESKMEEKILKEKTLEKHEAKKEDLQSFIDRFKAKSSKARQAQSKMKLVEKLEEEMEGIELSPSSRLFPKLRFDLVRPSGAITLTVKSLFKSYADKQVLKDITFSVERGDRIAIIGANGIGKSTLLEILTQNKKADQGAFEWGFAAQYAYFPQDHKRDVYGSISLLDWLGQFDTLMPEERLREILARVLFSGDDVKKPVSILSGGETARLVLAKMMLLKHNVLIFDEPTNHLDMEATEALLEALQNYPGTLIFVSHNRHFVSKIANRIIEISDKGLKDFRCTYIEYLAQREVDFLSAKLSLRKETSTTKLEASDQKIKFQEQKNQRNIKSQLEKKIDLAEKKCQQLEEELKTIDSILASEGFFEKESKEKQKELFNRKNILEKSLEDALNAWEKAGDELQAYIQN